MGAPKDPEKYKEFIRKMKSLRGPTHPNFGRRASPETRKLLSKLKKGTKQSPEWVAKRIAATTASPNRGANISRAKTGKPGKIPGSETRLKMSIARKGKKKPPFSEEHCKNISLGKTGKPSPLKGKKDLQKLVLFNIRTWFYKLPMRKVKRKKPVMSKELLEKKIAVCKNRIWTAESRDKIKAKRVNWKIPYEDTKPEKLMQLALAVNGIKFQKHKPFKLGRYWHRVDIFIEPDIIVEVDGIHWHLMDMKDVKRDLFQSQEFTIMGYHVIRIRDKDILKNTQNCAEKVIQLIKELQHRHIPLG